MGGYGALVLIICGAALLGGLLALLIVQAGKPSRRFPPWAVLLLALVAVFLILVVMPALLHRSPRGL